MNGAVDASKFSELLKTLSDQEVKVLNLALSRTDEMAFFGQEFYVICMMKICVESEKLERDASFLEKK